MFHSSFNVFSQIIAFKQTQTRLLTALNFFFSLLQLYQLHLTRRFFTFFIFEARSESKSHELQGKVMYQEGEEGDHIRTITKSLESERDRSRVLEGKLRQREGVIEEQKERAERFEMMTKKYTKELQEHENNIEKLEMRASGASSGRGSRGSDEEEEE